MKKLIQVVFLVVFSAQLFAQDYKFGKVTKEELQETECDFDKDASAALLYNHRETYLLSSVSDLKVVTKIYKKIKVYKKEGFDYATESVILYKDGGTREQIRRIKAVTYNLEGEKIKEYKLDKDNIFETNLAYSYYEVTFTLPNVKEGSVMEIEYEVNSPFYWIFDDVVFQADIPTKKYYAEVRTFEYYKYKRSYKGFVSINDRMYSKMDHRLGANVDITEYNGTNIPALKKEPLVDNMENYRGAVVYELSYYSSPTSYKAYSRSWGDVAQQIGNKDDYMEELDKTRFVDDLVDGLVKGKSDPKMRMQILFDYVKTHFKWNEVDGKYFDNGLKKTMKEHKGNAADINLMLVAMLRYAGLDANPVVISTKDNTIPFFPTLERLNYVIAHVNIDGASFLMDATREFSEINVLPVGDYNWQGIYINNPKMKWNKVSLNVPEQALTSVDLLCTLSEDGSSEGRMRYTYMKHAAMNFRYEMKDVNQDTYLTDLETELGGIEIDDFKTVNTEDTSKPYASQSFSFIDEEAAEIIGDKIYITPLMLLLEDKNVFVEEERKCPVDFGYPFEYKYNIIVNIPEGYKIEYSPDSKAMNLPENMGGIKYIIKETSTGFQLAYDLQINWAMVGPNYYVHLKEFFNKMIEIEAEKIILSKA